MRRVGLVLLLVVAVATLAGVWTSSASAYAGGPGNIANNPANRDLVRRLLSNPELGAGGTATEEAGLTRALITAGRLPTFTALGSIPIGSYVVYKIADAAGLQGFIYKKITGESYNPGQVAWAGHYDWEYQSANPCISNTYLCQTDIAFLTQQDPNKFWEARASGSPEGVSNGSHTYNYCWPSEAFNNASVNSAMAGLPSSYEITAGDNGVCTTGASRQHIRIRTLQDMRGIPQGKSSSYSEWVAQSGYQKKTTGAVGDTSNPTDSEVAAALHEIGADDSVDRTSSDPAAEAAVNWLIGHIEGAPTFTPFVLPEPEVGMTYQQYVATLRARGWLGTLTIEPASALEAAADPASAYAAAPLHAPAGVLVSGAPMVWVFDTTAPTPGDRPDPTWPDNPPHINSPNTPVTIKEKPGTSGLPPPVGGGGECECTVDPIVLPSISSPCDKFPFGVFCWVGGVVDLLFLGDAEAPSFHLHVGAIATDIYTLPDGWVDMTVDFADLPDSVVAAMNVLRLVLAFLVWFFGLFFMGRRLLGAGGGDGDGVGAYGSWQDGSPRNYSNDDGH